MEIKSTRKSLNHIFEVGGRVQRQIMVMIRRYLVVKVIQDRDNNS